MECTAGSVVGQQPFGGSRASGTNDKAVSLNLISKWTSPQVRERKIRRERERKKEREREREKERERER